MAATIPGDIIQYFGNLLFLSQKLAYLYGYEDMKLDQCILNDGILDEILIFFGVMSGVQAANTTLKIMADQTAKNVSKIVGARMTKNFSLKNFFQNNQVIGDFFSGA